MRFFLVLVASCAAIVAQESRPFGLLPAQSPLAPVQEALLRGDAAEARGALDAIVAGSPSEVLASIAPRAALLRAASEPVGRRASAMLGVATAYADDPIAEAAAVAGLAALLSDGPEVGDLAEPLLPRPDGAGRAAAEARAADGASPEWLLARFLDVLERRVLSPGRDRDAIDHARRLLAQFPSQAGEWTWVRPSAPLVFPARIDDALRLRFFAVDSKESLPDPSHVMLPEGPPAIDVVIPANREGIELPALTPGAWLVVATGSSSPYRRAWPLVVTDLELIVHSLPGALASLGLGAGKPVPDVTLTKLFDPRFASRTRGAQLKEPDNAVLGRSGANLATAPISAPATTPPEPEPRFVADLLASQPVYGPGATARLRLVARPTRPRPESRPGLDPVPVRIVFWPRQPHEVTIEERVAGVLAFELPIPAAAPPGPVRVQVFDATARPVGGVMPEPVLDAIPFSVQGRQQAIMPLFISCPSSWKPGDPAPRVELLSPSVDGLDVLVEVTAGSFRMKDVVSLDASGSGAIELGLPGWPADRIAKLQQVEVHARLMAGGFELAKTSRRISVASEETGEGETKPLRLAALTPAPLAGEPLRISVSGPAGEPVLVSAATATQVLWSAPAVLGADGRAEIETPTTPAWWPAVELSASTRNGPRRGGALGARLRVACARPGAPVLTIESPKDEFRADEAVRIGVRVSSRTPLADTTVSVTVVDEGIVRFAGTGMPDPGAALQPRTAPPALRATGSPAPLDPAAWYASVLGRADRVPPPSIEPRPAPAASRGWPRGPIGRAAEEVPEPLGAANACFVERVELDARGEGGIEVRFPSNRASRWRVVAVAIDGEGRSTVAAKTIACARSGGTEDAPPGYVPALVTRARAFLGQRDPATQRFVAIANPARIGPATSISERVLPFPGALSRAIEEHLDPSRFACADHVAARVILRATAWGGVREASSMRASTRSPEIIPPALETDLVRLRELKTRDGYAWTPGGPTDFEITPLVLHALALAADTGVDPATYSAVPEMRDGFLRVAPRAFSEAQGNPQAAVEGEEVREHSAFLASVPPERRAIVLVETVIGMLALDPGLTLAKSAVAALVRQSQEVPGPTLARAAVALLRAGDSESALLAWKRCDAIEDEDVPLLALQVEASLLFDGPEARRIGRADKLASRFTEPSWPPVYPAALAYRALFAHFRRSPPPDERGDDYFFGTTFEDAPSEIRLTARVPSLAVVTRTSSFPDGVPASASAAPVVALFLDDRPLPGTPLRVPSGSRVRFTIAATAPQGACALVLPVVPGMRILSAAQGSVEGARVVWLFSASKGSSELKVEGLAEVQDGLAAWPPCDLVSLDTLETLGWSASRKIEVIPGTSAVRPDHAVVKLGGPQALAEARAAIVRELEAASGRETVARRLKELVDLPDAGVADALVSLLPRLAPFFDAPDVLAPVLLGLGAKRSEVWAPANLALVPAPRGTRLVAESVRDWPEARALIDRWLADRAGAAAALGPALSLARLRMSDPVEIPELWAASVVQELLSEALPDADALEAWRDVPFQRNFARLFSGAKPVAESEVQGWIRVLDLLEKKALDPAGKPGPAFFAIVAALTERSRDEVSSFMRGEVALRMRQGELRAAGAARALALLEARELPVEAAALPMLTDVAPVEHLPRLLRALLAEDGGGRGDVAIPIGVQALDRHRDRFSLDDQAGAALAAIGATGPRAWRVGAIQALAAPSRRALPLTVIEPLLRNAETRSDAIDLMLEREDAADLLMNALEQRMLRHEARRVVEKLAALDSHPFERKPAARLVALLAQLDPETGKPIEDELRRRAEENPAEVAQALAASRDERVRDALVKILGKVRFTEVSWDPADPVADKLRTKLAALAGDAEAGAAVRQWMLAAKQASQTQGAPDAAVQELWPYLVAWATPSDVLAFGAPAPIEPLVTRAQAWSEEEIATFLRSPEARPDPASDASHWGAAAVVVRAIAPGRRGRFADDLIALWRAYVAAGLSFDALSLFGHMGPAQVAVLREVLDPPPSAESRSAAFDDAQKIAYVAALSRDPAIERDVEPLARVARPPEVAAALARYVLEVTGYWREPATTATRPTPTPLQTAQDWQRALLARLRNEGLEAVNRGEPPILRAWEKTLRERGLGAANR